MRAVLLVGCPELRDAVTVEGFNVRQIEYFWGRELHEEDWVAAVVDTRVGGGTGLAVALRLLRDGIAPLVVFGAGERDRVLARFVGVQRKGKLVPEGFVQALERCIRQTRALRQPGPTTEVSVSTSMILAEKPNE